MRKLPQAIVSLAAAVNVLAQGLAQATGSGLGGQGQTSAKTKVRFD
jgi:hypothetical protein